MKSVALVGLAESTREGVNKSQADEIWTLNWAYNYDFLPRIDRLFEMHPIWCYAGTDKPEYEKPRRHWKWLHEKHPFPVYMLYKFRQLPSSVRYPIEDVSADLFGDRLVKGDNPHDLYSSSPDYMMALAIHEGVDVIELYGFEMVADTEYRYQREGMAMFIGMALARGIKVIRPENSRLLISKRYGYEGGQMIFRQDLEFSLAKWQQERVKAMARLQNLEGQYAQAKGNGATEEELDAMWKGIRDQRDIAAVCAGGSHAVETLIREVDLEEPELNIINPFDDVELFEESEDVRQEETAT